MEFWEPYFGSFWMFPLLCLVFMALMMLGCGGMLFRRGQGGRTDAGRGTARDILQRRYAKGEIAKEQYDAMRRELDG